MEEDVLPADVRNFLSLQIDSVAELEALLLLRANPCESWNTIDIAARLYVGERDVKVVLSRLSSMGLVAGAGDAYRYKPQKPPVRDVVDRVADAYARNLIPVTNLIHDKQRRIREFADAFRIRRGEGSVMTAAVVYLLCALAALLCTWLLILGYRRRRSRLLLWSGLSFAGLFVNNLLLVLDKIVFLQLDLSVLRSGVALTAMAVLLYGLIWHNE